MKKSFVEASAEYLHCFLEYKNGKLYWKQRGNSRFDNAWAGKEAGCFKYPSGYGTVSYKGGHLMVHRAVWIMHYGPIPFSAEIDHIDGNKANNKIENLRICSKSQNICNSKRRGDNTSGVKGISKTEDGRYWRARIQINGKRKELGIYKTLKEAETVITSARNLCHGNFANHGVHLSNSA